MQIEWRALIADDVPGVTALVNLATTADGTGRGVSEEAVAEEFRVPYLDLAVDTVSAWIDDDMVAFGSVFSGPEPVDGRAMIRVDGHVHPQHRGHGLGRELLARLETRAADLAAERHPGLPVRLRTSGGTPGSSTQRLLELAGYQPDNFFITMEVDLARWHDPGGSSEVVPIDERLLGTTRDAHNDAFRDHRNFSPIPANLWQHWMSGPDNRPALGRVVLDGDRVLAYSVVSESHPGVAHVELVGTRREARGLGLARAVLLGTLRAAHDAGCAVAELEVDSTSPTGADRLYTSVGFVPVRTISRYQRDL